MDAQATARNGLESIVPLTRETVVVVIATEIGASSSRPRPSKVGVAAGGAPERERARSLPPSSPRWRPAAAGFDTEASRPASAQRASLGSSLAEREAFRRHHRPPRALSAVLP